MWMAIQDELTYKIIGCCLNVHNFLGNGFQEVIYQRCVAIELKQAGILFEREQEQTILYKGIDVGTRRADFIIDERIIVDLKAIENLEDVHLIETKNYIVAYDFSIGLLINFGARSLQYKRIFHPKLHKNSATSKNPLNPDPNNP